jgi:hypothetical protein
MGDKMALSDTEKLSIRKKGLRYNLLVAEALVFILPFIILAHIIYKSNITFELSQIIIIVFSLVLILAGLIIIRQIFDRFIMMATSIKRASPLTGIDPHLLMRIDPPELYSGFDPSLIF